MKTIFVRKVQLTINVQNLMMMRTGDFCRYHGVFISPLLALETRGEGTTDSVGQPLPGVPRRQEAVTHPASGGPVPAHIAEAALVIAVRCAKRHLFDGLVHNEALSVFLNDAQAVTTDVQHSAHGSAARVAQDFQGLFAYLWDKIQVIVRYEIRMLR